MRKNPKWRILLISVSDSTGLKKETKGFYFLLEWLTIADKERVKCECNWLWNVPWKHEASLIKAKSDGIYLWFMSNSNSGTKTDTDSELIPWLRRLRLKRSGKRCHFWMSHISLYHIYMCCANIKAVTHFPGGQQAIQGSKNIWTWSKVSMFHTSADFPHSMGEQN